MFALGMAIERVALRRLAGRPVVMILMMTLGLDIFLRGDGARRSAAAAARPLRIGISDAPLFLGPLLINRGYASARRWRSRCSCCSCSSSAPARGVVLRAIADDYTASWSVGISVERGVALSWALAAVVATTAGVLWGSVQGVDQSLSLLLLKGSPSPSSAGSTASAARCSPACCSASSRAVAAGLLDPLVGGGTRDSSSPRC